MKKLFRTVLAVAVAAAAMTSCAKELSEKFESGVKVDMVGSMPETKTAFADPSGSQYPVIWKEGDNVAVIVNFGTGTPTALPVTPSADGKTAKFSAELPASIDPPYTFMVISPRNAWVSVNSTDKRLNYLIPSTQTASKDVVDPAAQVLVGVTDEITKLPADAIPITFKHTVAYGKITLKNLDVEGRAIQSITVKSETPIAGRWFYTPSTGDFAVNSGSNSIEIKTSDTEDVLFAAAPADISDKKLTVSVSVYGGVYTKEITVPAEKTFKVGTISKFSVDMTGATFEKSKVYTLLKNASALKEGDEIVMASSAPVLMTKEGKTPKNEEEAAAASKLGIVALGTQQNGNNRTGIVITDLYDETAGTITSPGDAVEVFTVEKGTADGTFAFKGKNGQYIVRPKQSGNYLRSQDANDDAAGWTVTLRNEPKFSQYAMDIVTTNAQYTATAKYIQINPNTGNQIVSCYANTQQEICIFVYDPSAGPVDKKDVVKWVPSAAGNEVFANGVGTPSVEPATADWLTWDESTQTVSWTEAAMPRQAKLSFMNGSTYDVTQIDAKIMAGKWTLSGDIRSGLTKGAVAKATADNTSGATYGSKGGIKKDNWYDDGWTTSAKVSGGVELPVTVTYNAEGEDPDNYLNPTATGTSADRAKAQKNNLVLTGLYENLTMPARAEVNYEEKWARLYLVIENKNQQLTSGVYNGEYASFQTELQKPNGDWELGFANGGVNYYLGALTVVGDVVKSSYAASQTCVYYPSYNMVGILVNRFATQASTAGTELIRSTKSVWTKTHIAQSGSAYARVFQNALSFEMKESAGPEPEPEPTTVEEVLTKAGKNPSDYEKLPFWYNKNKYYQSNSNNKTALITGSGSLLNKFVATNIVSKGEIPNGSVVVTMGGNYGYRPEGWVSGAKTTTRPDRTTAQVTEVDDAWWVVGGQNFNQRAFNLDMDKANLTDAEMDDVIAKFAVFVPKSTKEKPDPDAAFTAAGYNLSDYKKVKLTYTKYAFYNSTDGTNGGKLIDNTVSPTATNLGQFVATGYLTKEQIPNGSVLVVCDGYQYRPEGWQVQGEKNTGSRPGNVTAVTTVVDDAWWSNFTVRAFNLAYAGNPGIPVTEMDHVIASFAIYVPKVLTVERVWGKYPGEWPQLVGYNANEDRCVAMDENYVYVAKAAASTAGIKAISITDPTSIKDVNVTGIEGGHFPTSCVRTVYSTTKKKHILLASSMALSEGQTLKIYAWEDGIDAAPKVLLNWALGSDRRFGDFFTIFGTYEDAEIYFRNNTQTTDAKCNLTAQFILKDGALTNQWPNAFFNGYGGSKGMGSIYLYKKGGKKWYLVTDAIGMFFPAGEQAGEEWGNGDDYSVWAKLFGVKPFEFNGKKYIAYHKMHNAARGWVTITKDVNGNDEKFKDSLIQGKLAENIIFQGAVQINSDTPSTEVVSGATYSGNTMGNCDVIVKDDAAYIVSHQQNTGIAVFKMYMK